MRIYGNYDVVVVGGGASGCCAAIAAAREGANVCVIENGGIVGGMMNVVGPPGWAFCHLWNNAGEQIVGGIVQELYDELYKRDLAQPWPKAEFRRNDAPAFVDPDWCGLLFFEWMREAGVTFLLHSMAVDVMKEGDTVKGVIVENTSGRMAVMGKVIIEATGEGDIAARAGVPYTQIDRTKEELDPPSITFHMDGVDWDKVTAYFKENPDQFIPDWWDKDIHAEAIAKRLDLLKNCESIIDLVKDGLITQIDYHKLTMEAIANGELCETGDFGHFFTWRQFGHVQPVFQHTAQAKDCDTTDVTEYSWGEVECRRQVAMAIPAIQKYLPGYEKAYFTRLTSSMRTREGRHMIGDYQMQSSDVDNNAKFPDVVAKCAMDTVSGGPFHSASIPGVAMNITDLMKPGKWHQCKDGGSYDIPYRCFVPKKIEGMILTGKLISLHEDFKRDQLPDNMIWGQAAGIAAAICVRKGITPRELEADVSELQAILKKNGAILDGTK